MYEGKRVKEFRVTGNLNKSNPKMIMANITPHIEMQTNVVYSFKLDIHRGAGEIVPYYKTLTSPPGMFTSLEEIQAYIENLNKNGWIWIKKKYGQRLIYPQKNNRDNYEGKVNFKHVQIRLVALNEPFMCCGPMPHRLRSKRCIYAIDTFDDNLCVWRCLAMHKRHVRGEKNQVEKRNCRAAIDLAHKYCGDNKLKRKDARPTKLVDFEAIAKHLDPVFFGSYNIMLYEPKKARARMQDLYEC